MFIAFEGPSGTGRSTSANNLAASGQGIYSVNEGIHALMQKDHMEAPELPITYDRINWVSHMIYQLAMPYRGWQNTRVQDVFSMPDTHLVFKLPNQASQQRLNWQSGSTSSISRIDTSYRQVANYLMELNHKLDYSMFKTISIMEVWNTPTRFKQRLIDFSSQAFPYGSAWEAIIRDDDTLLELLRHVDQHTA